LELPATSRIRGLSLNTRMGFAQRPGWPLAERLAAKGAEMGIKVAVPAGALGAYKTGEWLGRQAIASEEG